MSWLELDDQILEHPKFIRAVRLGGDAAIFFWLGLRAYCSQKLTDGLIPADMIDEVRGPREPRRRVAALEALKTVGLVEDADGGALRLHDYLDWSSSREEVEARRRANADRQGRHRKKSSIAERDNNVSHGVTNASVTPSVTIPSPLPSSPLLTTPNPEIVTSPPARDGIVYSDHFLTFWMSYPRKVGKGDAWKAWKRLKPELPTVLLALANQRTTPDWRKDSGAFIPHPATWLNGRRWEDEPTRSGNARPTGPSIAAIEHAAEKAFELERNAARERLAAAERFRQEQERDAGGGT